jgi:uncharacterized protein (DUF885 family)
MSSMRAGFLAGSMLAFAATGALAAPTPGQQLNTIVERYWDEVEALNPVLATFNGNYRYNDRLANSISPAHVAAARALEQKYLDEVAGIDASRLEEQDRLTLAIFRRGRETALEGFEFPDRLLPIDQLGGLPSNFVQMGSGAGIHPFTSTKDYEDWLKRIGDFVIWCDQAIVNMREGIAAGVVQPRVVMEKALPQLESQLVTDPAQSIFHKPVEQFPAGVPEADRGRLRAALDKAIMEQIVPAFRRLHTFLRDEYLAKTRDTVSIAALPNGERWYAYLVRRQTTTNLTPAEIHDIGLTEVARIRGEMQKVMREVKFEGTLEAFFEYMRTDPKFYFTKEDDLLNGYRALKSGVAERLPRLFAVRPSADFEIRPVEPFRARSAAGGSYRGPTPDGKRPGVFYVNTFDLTSRPKYAMDALYLHEAEPGHHFQIAIQRELGELPRFRRFSGFTAFVEGWGLYAESLGKDLGLYADPYSYFGGLTSEMHRAIRLVVDTGLHSKGWTREQAITYMSANRPVGETVAIAETERYIANPGQALAYKMGALKIQELKNRAAAALGSRFDVRAFHSEVLTNGPLPLDVLETEINRWIASVKSGPDA